VDVDHIATMVEGTLTALIAVAMVFISSYVRGKSPVGRLHTGLTDHFSDEGRVPVMLTLRTPVI
jgi:hypothetical protein